MHVNENIIYLGENNNGNMAAPNNNNRIAIPYSTSGFEIKTIVISTTV